MTEKSVRDELANEFAAVTAEEVGRLCRMAVLYAYPSEYLDKGAGKRMLDQLQAAGLTIVRTEGGGR